jgi:cell division protein FtsX
LRRAARDLRRRPRDLIALSLAFTALTALGGAAVLAGRAEAIWTPVFEHNVAVIAYLRDDMSHDRAGALAELLRRIPGVAAVRSTSSAQATAALAGMAQHLGGKPALLEGIEEGFLPRSIEITLAPSPNLESLARALGERLARIDGVVAADTMADGLVQLGSWLTLARWVSRLALALAAVTAMLALVWSASRWRAGRMQEANVLMFLGATPAEIRLPGRMLAAACATGGALLGVMVVLGAFRWLRTTLASSFSALPAAPTLVPAEIAVGLLAAMAVGLMAGGLRLPSLRHDHG